MPDLKDTNPKDAVGAAKVPFSTVPARVIAETGLAMLEGALKYGRHNYRVSGVRASVYHDAALRHLLAFWEGQDIDPESGLSHLVKAIACCVVLRDSQTRGNWVDDRPPATEGDWVKELNKLAEALLEKYPDPVPAHTQLSVEAAAERDDHPKLILALDHEDWKRSHIWHHEDLEYQWRDGEWQYRVAKNPADTWETSYENEYPGNNGPFTRGELVTAVEKDDLVITERPQKVPALNEEWMRQYRWVGGICTYYWNERYAAWYVDSAGDDFKSSENALPGSQGPFTRLP